MHSYWYRRDNKNEEGGGGGGSIDGNRHGGSGSGITETVEAEETEAMERNTKNTTQICKGLCHASAKAMAGVKCLRL